MWEFLMALGGMFVLCWIWVGGYLADFVVWLVSMLTPEEANERALAVILGVLFFFGGVIAAVNTNDSTVGPVLGGAIAGAGLYIAVRLPGKIKRRRAARAERADAKAMQATASLAPMVGPVPPPPAPPAPPEPYHVAGFEDRPPPPPPPAVRESRNEPWGAPAAD